MSATSNNKDGNADKKYKAINLKYEYEGYIGDEKWAIISELSEEELFEQYPDEMQRYVPFVLLSVEQGEVISEYVKNEDKYRKRSLRNEDFFGYSEGLTENLHSEAVAPDFVEQQEIDEYDRKREELIKQLLKKAMESLTEKQYKYLIMRYVENKSAREIGREEGVAHQVIDRHIIAATQKIEKVFWDFFRK